MDKPRPSMFVGSSSEGLDVAKAIQLNLDRVCEVTLWSQGVFGLSGGTLETLASRVDDFDFAALVLTPDDMVTSREHTSQSARDNVLIELGLFIGAIGRQRTFVVCDRASDLKIPSDMAGVTLAEYQKHSDGNWEAALGAATTMMEVAVGKLGKQSAKIEANIGHNTQFQIIHGLLDAAPEQFFIWMYENDSPIRRDPRLYTAGLRYEYEMASHAAGRGSFSMDQLCEKLADADLLAVDLRNNVSLTSRGKQYAKWLVENGHKATYFRSDLGQWGETPEGGGAQWPPDDFGWRPPRDDSPQLGTSDRQEPDTET